MNRRVIILMSCFVLILSACSLFPLKKNEQPLIRNEESDESGDGETEGGSSHQVVKPAAIDEVEEQQQQNLVYCISPVNVREAGDSNARVLGALRTGDAVTKLSQEGGWVEIIFEGQIGFVYMDYISETPP